MDFRCAPDYNSIAFLSGCISITISVLGPNPEKKCMCILSHHAKEIKRATENQ